MMESYFIAIGLVKYGDKYLIGKRAEKKRFSPGKWEFLTGFVDANESPNETILREIDEEVKLEGKILISGEEYQVEDNEGSWKITPFLIEVNSDEFTLNLEDHSELRWVSLEELNNYTDLSNDIRELSSRGLLK